MSFSFFLLALKRESVLKKLLLCSNSHNVPTHSAPQWNVPIAAVRGAVRPSIRLLKERIRFCMNR